MRKVSIVKITARHNFNDLEDVVNENIRQLHAEGMRVVSVVPFFRNLGSPVMMLYCIIYETPDHEEKIHGRREVAVVKVTAKNNFDDAMQKVNERIEALYADGRRVVSISPFYKSTAPIAMIFNLICEVPKG